MKPRVLSFSRQPRRVRRDPLIIDTLRVWLVLAAALVAVWVVVMGGRG